VEHDADVISAADHVIDMGPGAGRLGGRIVAEGTPAELAVLPTSVTGPFLARRPTDIRLLPSRPAPGLRIRGARAHNLRGIDVEIPGGSLTAVTGVSGSGKSSLVFDVLLASARAGKPVACEAVEGLERFDRVLYVDQEPLAGGPLSTPATYLGLFDAVRTIFASTGEARARGFGKAYFSYLTREGRCETCGGTGETRISMDFLADVLAPCEDCGGRRYKPEILEVLHRGLTIAGILDLSAAEARSVFPEPRRLERGLQTLEEIGLGYLRLGQPLDTLSGGEAQRLKLAAELMKSVAGPALYLFDEPATGLHFVDIDRLLDVFGRLIDQGHTLVVVEHDTGVIARAGHVIDLGPEGGGRGGAVVATGPPSAIAACPASFTGAALRKVLAS
jgi:excinuclease ABC subunit A